MRAQQTRVIERIARVDDVDLLIHPGSVVRSIQEKLKRGGSVAELIVAHGESGDLVLIEGNTRATAFVGLCWDRNIPMFVASSPCVPGWKYYSAV